MARLEAEKQAEGEAATIEPSATAASTAEAADGGKSQPETVGTDSVDQLKAAYGETAETGEPASAKQAPES
jgi:hypothetical protein